MTLMRTVLLAVALAAGLQDPARSLVEKLRSERIDERDDAERALLALGEAAAAELRRAAGDAELEVAGRAKKLLRILELRRTLPPAVLKEFPGAEARLARDGHEWTLLFLEACRGLFPETCPGDECGRVHRSVRNADLAPLAAGAVRGAITVEEKSRVAHFVAAHHLRPALPDLLKLLEDPEEEVRKNVLKALGESDFRDAAPAVAALLADPDVGPEAEGALVMLGTPRVIPAVVPFLRHVDDGVRKRALECLQWLDARDAVKEIRPLFGDPQLSVRGLAAKTAGALGDREAIPRLLELLDDPESSVVYDAALALATLGERSIIPRLREILRKSRYAHLLSGAVEALVELEATEAVPEFVQMLTYPDKNQWTFGVRGLWWLRATEAAPDIRRLLSAKEATTRQAAAEILGHLHVREAAGDLAALLDDEVAEVRMEAISALEDLGATEAAPAIARRLGDSSEEVRRVAARALDRLDARALALPLVSALPEFGGWMPGPRYALSRWKAPETVPELVKLLTHEKAEARHVALLVLGEMKATGAIPEIRKRVEVPEDAGSAILALGRAGDRDAIPSLLKRLDDPGGVPWHWIASALTTLGERKAIPILIDRLKVEPGRAAVIELLGEFRAREAVAELRKHLRDPDRRVRQQLAQSLEKIGGPDAVAALRELLNDAPTSMAIEMLVGVQGRAAAPDLLRLALDEDAGADARGTCMGYLADLGAREAIPGLLTLLSSERTAVLQKAVAALGRLQGKEAISRLRELLKDERPGVVLAAAHALVLLDGGDAARPALKGLLGRRAEAQSAAADLARLGSEEGVPLLLRRFARRFALNRLRQPEVWARLKSRSLREDVQGSLRERWERLAKEAGLKLEVFAFRKRYEEDHFKSEGTWSSGGGLATLLDLVPENEGYYEVVLEADRIRLVSQEEAVKFWRSWWEERRRKE